MSDSVAEHYMGEVEKRNKRIAELEAERDKLKAEMAYDAEHIKSLRAELVKKDKRISDLENVIKIVVPPGKYIIQSEETE